MKIIKRQTKEQIYIILPIFFCVFLLCLNSCTTHNIEKTLRGRWGIDTLIYRDVSQEMYYNVLSILGLNIIYFEKNNKFSTYDLRNYEDVFFEWEDKGSWKVVSNNGAIPYHLFIESNNEVLRGMHKMWFCKDERKNLLKLVLFSEKLYLVASYGHWSYNLNSSSINSVIKATGCLPCDAAYNIE